MNRRSVWISVARTCVLGVFAWTMWTQTTASHPLTYRQIKDDLWVIDGTSNGSSDAGNIAVLVTSEGIVLIDDRFDQDYLEVTAAVKKISPLPIRYVVNTHHHGDHTGGNAKLLASNVEIVIHQNARRHMLDSAMPGLPKITFSRQASVFLGGKEVRSIYFGGGHTDGDVAVYIPHDHTVHLGDLMAGTRGVTNPVMDYANGGSLKAWPSTLDGALALDIDTVVPGHGSVTDKAGLSAHRDKIASILAKATSMVRQNRTSDEVASAMVADFDFKPINLRAVDGLVAELKQ